MSAHTETRDPSELEREASEIRADMDRTLDALERKFSPGQVLDRSMGYLRDHGGDLARNVGDTVKQNPIPVLLTAAGIAWLITSGVRSRSRYSRSADVYGDPYGDDLSSGDYASAQAGLRDRMSSKLQAGADAARDRLQAGAEAARRTWRSSRTTASGRVSRAMDSTRVRAQQVQQRAHTMMDEQPLVVGALALACGALIGAALPRTRYENRTLGPVRDRTLEKAKVAGEREYRNLRSKLEPRQDTQVSGRAN